MPCLVAERGGAHRPPLVVALEPVNDDQLLAAVNAKAARLLARSIRLVAGAAGTVPHLHARPWAAGSSVDHVVFGEAARSVGVAYSSVHGADRLVGVMG